MAFFKSIHGRELGLGEKGNLVANGIDITQPCVDAAITVGAESTNVRAITVQLKDAKGADIAYQEVVDVFVVGAANLNAIVGTGGSTGIEIGTDGSIRSARAPGRRKSGPWRMRQRCAFLSKVQSSASARRCHVRLQMKAWRQYGPRMRRYASR